MTVILLLTSSFYPVEQTYLWYSHWDCDGEFRNQDIGLATLRRDGFGYLTNQKSDAPAMCETTFFEAGRETKVFVNVEGVSPDAPLKVELLDEKAQLIPGYSQDASADIHQPGTRIAVKWRSPLPQNERLALRVSLPTGGKTRLFALYLEGTVSFPTK